MTKDKCESILKNDNKNNNHVGIRNVNDRIQICFGKEYGVTIISEVDKGTKIKIRLPLKKDNNLIVTGLKDFNLHHIFDCGQCFRFNAVSENSYFGIAKNKALLISQNDDEVIFYDTTEDDFKNIWYDYFDLNRDYSEIKSRLSNDPIMKEAVSYGDGIRILNQDLWEAVISFIISASNNIPRIKGIIERLCENFGKQISYMGKTY